MTTDDYHMSAEIDRERARLIGFAALMLLAGLGLGAVGGPPRPPSGVPDAGAVLSVLRGSSLPVEPLALLLLDVTWLLWGWMVGSLLLQLLVVVADVLARGAAWVGSLRQVVDRLSVPLVRRAVVAAFAVQVLSRGVGVASAAPLESTETMLVQPRFTAAEVKTDPSETAAEVAPAQTYQVRTGDTLWSIAEQAYGSGAAYRRIVEANLGRRMPDGDVFSARGVIRAGWELVVPDAAADLEEADGQRWYTVRPGDTLSRVAGRVLGDDARWRELFALNRGVSTADGGHVLADPNVIWPGLRLRMPERGASQQDVQSDAPATVDHRADTAEPVSSDLVAASAPTGAPSIESRLPPVPLDGDRALAPDVDTLPALVRTPPALEPIVLEPAEADSEPASSDDNTGLPDGAAPEPLPVIPLALGGAGLAVLAGAAFGARRWRRLRPLPRQPESEVVVEGGFAEAQLAQDFTRGLHGVGFDPLAALVGQLEAFVREHDLASTSVLSVRHGRSATTIALKAGLAEQRTLIDLAPVFAERLNAVAETAVSADHDVVLRLVRLRKTRLLPAADALRDSPCLVPLGVLYDRQVYSAAWNSLGHVLVVSLPGHGADTILTSLVATLTARRSPEQLRVWIVGASRALPSPIFDLPHLVRVVDPTDQAALARAADDLRAELDRRAANRPPNDLVLVVPELASLGEQSARFELLLGRAAELGVRVVAASMCPTDVADSPLLSQFTTRMVLRMQEEEASVALLGVADAAFLGGGGRLLLRHDGREPLELYGYQVPTEHLERLVRVMRSAYASAAAPASPPPLREAEWRPTSTESTTAAEASDETDATPRLDDPPSAPTEREPPRAPAEPHSAEHTPPASPDDAVAAKPAIELVPLGPPIEVICFGGPRVRYAGRQVWPRPRGGDMKPWELLLFVAVQPPEGVSTRDAVEALWPDDESADDPGHRFRQLRYRLRRLLAAEVDATRDGDGICLERGVLKLDPAVVHSDAQEFLSLVRCARVTPGPDAIEPLERARSLFQGDLLAGPEARRYAWVDERDPSGVTLREHFRRLYQQASVRLAELYAAGEEVEAALELYRELTDIDPGDERLWRALFRLHAERGDRLGLVREERRMREALRELADEVDDPSASPTQDVSRETVQEYQRLLASLGERDREPVTA